MTNDEVIKLLRQKESGYDLTKEEREYLSKIQSIRCVGIDAIPPCIDLLSSLSELHIYGDNINGVWLKSIPESVGHLRNLTVLDLHDNRITWLPESIGNLTRLKNLILSGNRIQKIPNSIENLISLRVLDFSNNQISEFPKGLTHLNNVERIELSDNSISALPYSIGDLTNIKRLYLNNNNISILPDSICCLKYLNVLELSGCPLRIVPESIFMMEKLLTLDLDNTQISELPDSIGMLKALKNIRLSNCPIRRLPETFGELKSLKYLDLSNSNISVLPDSFGNLTDLETLELRKCQISELPQSIGNLVRLPELNLNSTPINEVPESIYTLKNLERLDFSDSQLKRLPERIGELTNLQILCLDGSQIEELPESVGELTNLRTLKLSSTRMTKLPRSIGLLLNLEELDISKTQIDELPVAMGMLNNLIKLDISCTLIRDISILSQISSLLFLKMWETRVDDISCLEGLKNLYTLDISVNNITDISSLSRLESLTSLDFSGTNVDDIGSIQGLTSLEELKMAWVPVKDLSALQGLVNITDLNLFETMVNDISPLNNLKSLKTLNISRTKLDYIPEFLLDLNLDFINEEMGEENGIYIKDLKLMNEPVEVFFQSRNLIIEYLRNRDDRSKVIVGQCKVVFLGDGGSGKSTSIGRILLNGEKNDYDVYQTIGGNVNKKSIRIGYDDIDMYMWDFGGQTIFHTLHRLFMNQRALYIIFIDSRRDRLQEQAEYWLREVSTYAYGCPVLLVINKIDVNRNAYINEFELKKFYPFLKKVITLSALFDSKEHFNLRLVDEIRHSISEMDSVYARIPLSWKRVLIELRSLDRQYIEMGEYERICKNYGITNFEEISHPLLDWIVDLGIGFYMPNDNRLNKYLVLQPSWLMNAVGKIIGRANFSQNGFVEKENIYKAINDDLSIREHNDEDKEINYQYSEVEVSYILEVLHKFEISFESKYGTEFFPIFCRTNETSKYSDIIGENCLHYIFKYDFLPDSVVHRLIVKMQDDLDYENIWYHGAVFRNGSEGYDAYVNASSNQIDVYIGTKSEINPPIEYLYLLRSKISQINQDMNIVSEEYVCYSEGGLEAEFSYEMLIGTKKSGITGVYSKQFHRVILIDDILRFENKVNKNIVNDILDVLKLLHVNPSDNNTYEDAINLYVRDLIEAKGYYCKDQRVRTNEKRVFEVDIIIMNPMTDKKYFFEASIVKYFNRSFLIKHIQRLLSLYNVNGNAEMFFVSYISSNKEQFRTISNRIFEFIAQEGIESESTRFIPYKCEEVNTDFWGLKCKKITYLTDNIPYIVFYINVYISGE